MTALQSASAIAPGDKAIAGSKGVGNGSSPNLFDPTTPLKMPSSTMVQIEKHKLIRATIPPGPSASGLLSSTKARRTPDSIGIPAKTSNHHADLPRS